MESRSPAQPPRSPSGVRQLAPSLILNALCPYLFYQLLSQRGVPTVPALTATAVFPIAGTLVSWVRTRHADGIGIISLVFIVLGAISSLLSGDVHFFLVKESFLTGLFGLVCLGSLLLSRPLMFYFSRQFATAGDPEQVARWDALWQYPTFRHGMRLVTAVWGLAYVGEAIARVIMAFLLPPPVVVGVSPVLALAVTVVLIAWSFSYGRAMRRRGEAATRAAGRQSAGGR